MASFHLAAASSSRHRLPFAVGSLLLALALTGAPTPAHALRIGTWNLLDYPSFNLAGRQPVFRTVMQNLDVDILMVQELTTTEGADSFYFNVLKVANPNKVWKNAGYLVPCQSTVFYDSAKVAAGVPTALTTSGPRAAYQILMAPRGYSASAAKFRLYSIHFKAGTANPATADSTRQRQECTDLRNTFNNAPTGTNIILGGDTNFYGDWEGGYQRLTEVEADNDGRLKDTFSMPGTWNQPAYACYHTQCPCANGCGAEQSGGGLDDRFDLLLYTYTLADHNGLDVLSSYAYGNDCNHYNTDINGFGYNTTVGIDIANALHDASDHIPAVLELQLPAKIAATSQLDFGTSIMGANITRTVSVANAATQLPVDSLRYSFVSPADFTAPTGTFAVAAGAPANTHSVVATATQPGVFNETLALPNNDVDSTATKNVLLSGTVLGHAVPSLDSVNTVQSASVTFGNHPQGGFSDLAIPVWNRGWNNLQARLSVTTATITGGGGRFSIPGGFSPALLSGGSASIPVHFDDSGATLGQQYTATLTVTSTDGEALPGASARPNLTVLLVAVVNNSAGVDDAPPHAIAFLAPRPNPFARATTLHFELPKPAPVSLGIYDLSGRRVALLAAGVHGAGRYDVRWDGATASGARVTAGLYFARFLTPGFSDTRRVVVMP